ncbi:MAG: hypothetical protein RR957_01125, partial [Oscillospiraceae bacterium]
MKILKLCMCFLLFWNILCSSAVASDDYLSNKIGTVLSTDIISMIDYKPIPSYNINGYTYIMAEELSDYGFDVEWNADKRTLDITRNNCINANLNEDILYAQHVKKNEIGIKIFDVLNTDIQTFLDGKISNSYNVGGQTLIQIDELMQYG